MRHTTHPGIGSEASGSFVVPNPDHRAHDVANRIVTNPVIKLLVGLIAALLGLAITIGVAYISLTVSNIDTRLDGQDQTNAAQDVRIRKLEDWQTETRARAGTVEEYAGYMQKSVEQGDRLLQLLERALDRLSHTRK